MLPVALRGKKGERIYFHNERSFLRRVLAGYRYLLVPFWTCSAGWNERNIPRETDKQTNGRVKVKWPKVQTYQKYMQFFTRLYNLSRKKMDSTIPWCQAQVGWDSSFVLVDSLAEMVIDHCVLSTEKLKVKCRAISANGIRPWSKMKTNSELQKIKPENNWRSHPVIPLLWD